MSNTERPLSPHLSIYRWPITMTLSILHRISGVMMTLGLVVFAWWLVAVAMGGVDYDRFTEQLTSLPGRICLVGWSFAFFLHLANGLRHLVWDFGHGFEIRQAEASAWLVLLIAIVMTLIFWMVQ